MKKIALILSTFFTLISYGQGLDYPATIKLAESHQEKEQLFLEWALKVSQKDILKCDSLIRNRGNYVQYFSRDAQFNLATLCFVNAQFGGALIQPKLNNFHFNKADSLLMHALLQCYQKVRISSSNFQLIQSQKKQYNTPTKKSIYYAVSTFIEGETNSQIIDNFITSLRYSQRSQVKPLPSALFDVFSGFYLKEGDHDKALHYQQKGVKYAKINDLTACLIHHWINIGEIQFSVGNYQQASQSFLAAENNSIGLRLPYIIGQLYNWQGKLYNQKNKLSKSVRYYRRSLSNFYRIDYKKGLAIVHKNIGEAYFNKGEINLSLKHFLLSQQFMQSLNMPLKEADLYYNMAELYLSKNQLIAAENKMDKAFSLWKKEGSLVVLNKGLLLYARIKDREGEYQLSNQYLKQYIQFRDSFRQTEAREKIAQLSHLFRSEQKERRIVEQEKQIKEALSQRLLAQNKLKSTKQKNRFILISSILLLILAIAVIVIIRVKGKQEQLQKKQKEMELQQALLRTQMNPHFIFNAMSVIQSYIYDEDFKNSSQFLVHFSKLMRMILENGHKKFVSLEKEMEINKRYLTIQKMRFENRFSFEIENNIPSPESIFVPPMLLQPFIENAIEHADLEKVDGGVIKIRCGIQDKLFIFTVEDNGIGRKAAHKQKEGRERRHKSMAIKLTKSRIELLNTAFKKKGGLIIEDLDKERGVGTKITILTPYVKNY